MPQYPELTKKLQKAKIHIMTSSVFLSSIALGVSHIISDEVDTAATNGLRIWYNPKFILNLSVPELAGLVAHECWHIAFQHAQRKEGKNHKVYNMAADHVINLMLLRDGYMLPEGGLADSKFCGKSTGEVYNVLIQDWKDEPDQQPPMMDLDAPESPAPDDKKHQDAVRDIIIRANTQSKMAGKQVGEVPGEISRKIEELVNLKMPWQGLLQRFLTSSNHIGRNYKRKNPRYKVFIPQRKGKGLGHLTFAIDTSGSVSNEELTELLSELKGIKDTFNPKIMTILDCDRVIHNVHTVEQSDDILDLKFTGGGGTSFQPVMEYVKEHPTEALVYFTDLYGSLNLDPPDIPVLWICNSTHDPAPFGETIYID